VEEPPPFNIPRKAKKGKKLLQPPKYKPSLVGLGFVPGLPGIKIGKPPKFVIGGGIRGIVEPKKKKKKKRGLPWWFA
jgi:hypothetical protein